MLGTLAAGAEATLPKPWSKPEEVELKLELAALLPGPELKLDTLPGPLTKPDTLPGPDEKVEAKPPSLPAAGLAANVVWPKPLSAGMPALQPAHEKGEPLAGAAAKEEAGAGAKAAAEEKAGAGPYSAAGV